MLDLLYNIISELLGIIVVTAVLPLIWFLVNLKRRKRERNLAREISDKLKFFEIKYTISKIALMNCGKKL